jgi:hypothetical protein
MKWVYKSFLLLSIFLLISCASGHKIKYHDTVASISTSGSITITVTTHDQRQYILSGESTPDYVGLNRGGLSAVPFKPHSVATESGKPLAEDITTSICNSLAAKGFRTVAVNAIPSEDKNKILAKMKEVKGDRLLLLTLYEWQSDTYMNTGLFYNMKFEVFDMNGNKLTEKIMKGEDNLGHGDDSFGLTIVKMQKIIPKVFKDKIEVLLNNKDVVETLK